MCVCVCVVNTEHRERGSVCVSVGTPATVSQMAKDVTTFLRWASGE